MYLLNSMINPGGKREIEMNFLGTLNYIPELYQRISSPQLPKQAVNLIFDFLAAETLRLHLLE